MEALGEYACECDHSMRETKQTADQMLHNRLLLHFVVESHVRQLPLTTRSQGGSNSRP